eukprot:7213518-Prymnesium_polylepis.1
MLVGRGSEGAPGRAEEHAGGRPPQDARETAPFERPLPRDLLPVDLERRDARIAATNACREEDEKCD